MKKKNKLFALLLLPVIGMTVISGCSSAEKTSTGNEVVVNNNGNDYYLDAGIIVNLGKNGELSAVGCEATEDNNNVQYVDNIAPEKLSKYKSCQKAPASSGSIHARRIRRLHEILERSRRYIAEIRASQK